MNNSELETLDDFVRKLDKVSADFTHDFDYPLYGDRFYAAVAEHERRLELVLIPLEMWSRRLQMASYREKQLTNK